MKRRTKSSDEERGVALTPYRVIQDAIRAVPAVRYALGVAGIVSVIAVVASFRVDPRIAVWGTVIIMVLMVGLVVFAKLTTTAKKHFLAPALVLMWSFLGLLILTATLLFTSVFFKFPVDLRSWLGGETTTGHRASPARAKGLVQLAASQAAEHECAMAWDTLNQAVEAAPKSVEVRKARRDFAMAWLREDFNDASTQVPDIGDIVQPVLYEDAQGASGKEKAEILAHIGLAMFNRDEFMSNSEYREGPLREALALDPANATAHAVLGVIAAYRDKKYLPEEFAPAIADPAHQKLGRLTRGWALSRLGEAGLCPTFQLAVAAWKAGEELPIEDRLLIGAAYEQGVERLPELCPDVPIASHYAAFERLVTAESPTGHAVVAARLLELSGDLEAASKRYMSIRKELRKKYDIAEPDVEEGLWRCAAPALRQRAPEIVDDKLRWTRFEAEKLDWWWRRDSKIAVTDLVDGGRAINTVTNADGPVQVTIVSTAGPSIGCGKFEAATGADLMHKHPLAYLAWSLWSDKPDQDSASGKERLRPPNHDVFLAGVRLLDQLQGRDGEALVLNSLVELSEAIAKLPARKVAFLDASYVRALDAVWGTSATLKLDGPGDSIELPAAKRLSVVMALVRGQERGSPRPLTVDSLDPDGRGAKLGLQKDDLIWGVNSVPVMTERELRRELLKDNGPLTINVVREYHAVDLPETGAN
jgi:hypothetical protein